MTEEYLKVIDAPGLLRDPHSKAIIAADSDTLLAHRKKKQAIRSVLNKNMELKQEVDQLKSQIARLEQVVESLVTHSLEK